ncbi:MAG: TonB-dependent receptor [Desulfobacteraceae bacterium]
MSTMAKWKAVLIIGAVGWILHGPAQVQAEENANRMAEIVVTAKPLSGSEAAGTVHRITAEQIRRQGVDTLDEALELVPGVIVREGPEGTPRIDIRGFRTRHVQLFINGIPIRETFDDQFDPTTIPVENIAEIKVTTGGGSVLYGQGGNGGAIDIITKKGTRGVQGAVSAEAGTGERYIGRASVGAANDKVDVFVSASYYDRDHFNSAKKHDTFEGVTDERLNSDRQRTSFFGNMGYHLTERTQLGLTVSHDRGENGKPPVLEPSGTDPFAKNPKYERTDNLNNTTFQVALSGDPEGPLQYRVWGYHNRRFQEDNRYDNTMTSNDPDTWTQVRKNSFHEESDTRIQGVSAQLKYQAGQAGIATLGLNGEKDRWEADGFTVTNNSGTTAAIDEEREVKFYSAALEYEHNFSDRLGGVIGYSRQFMNKDEDGGRDENDFTYLIGAFWEVTDGTLLRANHARKVRFPSIKQLYDTNSGNPDLNPEITWHYEVGVQQTLPGRTSLQLTGFYIKAEDFIEKDSMDVYQNFQELEFKGVETALTTRVIDNAMLRIAYTHLYTQDKSDNATREELQYRPATTVTVEGSYAFGFGLSVFASMKYVAGQYFYDSTETMKKELDDFAVVNLKLTQALGASGFNIYAGADNLLDESYEESYLLPQPGRTLYAGVEYRF